LPKPTSIRAMQYILYFKLAMIVIVLVLSLLLIVIPADFSGGWSDFRNNVLKSMFGITDGMFTAGFFGTVVINFSIPIIFMLIMLWFIRRKKLFPSLITAFVVLWFSSSNQIQLLLSLVILLLFFLKSTRTYFRSVNAIEPEPSNELEPAIEQHSNISEVHIREATPEDADTIHNIMLIAFEE
jgi:hypothetical protein